MNLINLIPYQLLIAVFLAFSGFIIRSSLLIVGQSWVRGYHNLATYTILPNIAFIITIVIANNIALSLGMIGALSIVRFRHPVKSPLELTIFFALITLGIASSVNFFYSLLLVTLVVCIIFGIEILQLILKKYGYSTYSISFNEGVSHNIIEIEANNEISLAEKNTNLQSSFHVPELYKWQYKLVFIKKTELNEFKNQIMDNKNITSIKVLLNI